jgi:hypothetical protein
VNVPALMASVAVVLGAAITGGMAWLVTRRTSSGKIARSTAADLWTASDQLQTRLLAEVDRMQRIIDSLRTVVAAMTTTDVEKSAELVRLHGVIDDLEAAVRSLRELAAGRVTP